MAERARQLESTSGDPRDEGFPWSKLPRELQHKVLSCLSLAALFQARSVCREWSAVVHRHEFATLYDEVQRSALPAPAICYTNQSAIEWARYDYAAAAWKKMTRLAACNPSRGEDCSVYAVGGLLCFHYQSRTWVVWNPLTGRWKTLPPYHSRGAATAFVCAFEAGAAHTPSYKILMAHYQVPRHQQREQGSLVTQVYDSATGTWTPEHTRQLRIIPFLSTRGGVLGRNGVVYFRSNRNSPGVGVERVLLCYDIRSGQWREEASDRRCTRIFEWDGRVMTVMVQEQLEASKFVIFEWDPRSRKWGDTGLEIPKKVKRRFDYSVSMSTALLEMIAAREFLVVAGYARDGSFGTAVYNDVEKKWRCHIASGSLRFARSATCRLNGMVQFQPRLDWVP